MNRWNDPTSLAGVVGGSRCKQASLVPNCSKLNVCATERDLRRGLPVVHAALDVHRQELTQLFGSLAEWLALLDLSGRQPSS